jgi:dihydroxy-acid dehydratase
MYTANTMASAIEALGMSLPGAASNLAVDEGNEISAEKRDDCVRVAQAVVALLQSGLKARDIMTRKAFENALTVAWALGGSTNAVLHLLAIAHEADVELTLADIEQVTARVPLLGNF